MSGRRILALARRIAEQFRRDRPTLGLVFVAPIVVGALPHSIQEFAAYLPSNAGGALWGNPLATGNLLNPWAGFAVLCGYAVVLIAAAAWRLRRHDA